MKKKKHETRKTHIERNRAKVKKELHTTGVEQQNESIKPISYSKAIRFSSLKFVRNNYIYYGK